MIGDCVCAPICINTVDHQHVFEVAARAGVDIDEVTGVERSLVPIYFVQRNLETCIFKLTCWKSLGQRFTVTSHIGVEHPESMRIEVRTNDARLLQDGDRQRTADVIGRTITWTVDLLAD